MTTATAPEIAHVKALSQWEGGARTLHQVRRFPAFYTDEPEDLGGTDTGPNPMETVLAAYNGCLAVMIHQIAGEMNFRYSGLELSADGAIDLRGMHGKPGVRRHFQRVTQTIAFDSPESEQRLHQLREAVESRCPAFNLLRDAGVDIRSNWTLR
ncbi:MAG: OsmC family protein [Bacillota bacterium]